MAFVSLLLILALTWWLWGRIAPWLSWLEHISTTVVSGLLVLSWLYLGAALALGPRIADFAVPMLLIGGIGVIVLKESWRSVVQLKKKTPASLYIWMIWVAVTSLGAWMMWRHYLPMRDGNLMSAGYTWADLALHLSLSRHFAVQQAFSLDFSLFPGLQITYPFLPDLLSGYLERGGIPLAWTMIIPNTLLFGALAGLLMSLGWRVTRSVGVAILLPIMTFCVASVGGLSMAWKAIFAEKEWWNLDYSNLVDKGLNNANFVTSQLLPQRTYLAGVAVVALVLLLVWKIFESKHKSVNKLWWVVAILIGLLPLTHAHSFLVAGLIVLMCVAYRYKEWRAWLLPATVCIVMILPQVIWQAHYNSGATDAIERHAWWMKLTDQTPLEYWWQNIGVLLVVMFVYPLWRYWNRDKSFTLVDVLWLVAVVLFAVGNVFQLHPNLWDNMKVLSFSFIFLTFCMIVMLTSLWKHWLGIIVTIVLLGFQGAVGAQTIVREFYQDHVFLSKADIAFAHVIEDKTAPDAIILQVNRHSHPSTVLAGRKTVFGYDGWIWSYGIDYAERMTDRNMMFKGGIVAESLFKKYDVSYIAFHDWERQYYGINQSYFSQNYALAAQVGGWQLYDLRKKLTE